MFCTVQWLIQCASVQYCSPVSLRGENLVGCARRLMDEHELVLYCDLHGHSHKSNVFIYGNDSHDGQLRERFFPFMLSRNLTDAVRITQLVLY